MTNHDPVAIVGLGCRLPGAETPAQFWTLLCQGVDATTEIPGDREEYRQPGAFGRFVTRRGGFVHDVHAFDPYFFGMSPREAIGFDPQQRFLLEAAWRAAEDAGVTSEQLQGARTGVFVGLCNDDYLNLQMEWMPDAEFQAFFSSIRSNGSGRLSHALGLTGPSVTVDTACSSSLVCVHLAVRSIQAGDCDFAFAGGANAILATPITRAYMRGGLLSPAGQCRTFLEDAGGFVRSEGAGVVLLKRLDRARKDGDRIYAVIRGSAVNSDGGSAPFMTPSRRGQVQVIQAACTDAGISPSDLAYVEAHGTGTPTGDPIELGALAEVMGERTPDTPLRIGSAKTNVGHLEGSAGVVGLMKAALAIHHGTIPPSIHTGEPNSKIPWSQIPISVPRTLAPWPENASRLAGVSSFGIFGTNAHVVLAEARVDVPPAPVESPRAHLLPISARDEASLRELAAQWRGHLLDSPDRLGDLCHTAGLRRTHFGCRLVVFADTREQLSEVIGDWLDGRDTPRAVYGRVSPARDHQVVLVFSGVGSHWPGMARDLHDRYPVFRQSLEHAGAVLAAVSGLDLIAELRRDEATSRLDLLDVGQPALFAVQVALGELWKSWGVEPGIVIGHSLGEIAAAHVAGALSLEDAASVVVARSQLMAAGPRGGMLACGLTPDEGAALIHGHEDRVAVGVISGRRSIVLSGDPAVLEEISRQLEASGTFCRRVNTQAASHSPLVDSILGEFARRIAAIRPQSGGIPLHSTVTGARIDGAALTPEYWVRNLRDAVIFGPAMERMLDEGERVFIEVSAHPLLIAPMQESAAERTASCLFVPSLRRRQDSETSMLEGVSRLHAAGHAVRWEAFDVPGAGHVDIPGHPFRRERIWLSLQGGGRHAEQAFARLARPRAHALLPLRLDPADQTGVHVWEGTLDPADHPFLAQHKVQGQPVLPAAAYYDMAYAIAAEVFGPGPRIFSHIQLKKALFLQEGTVRIQVVLAPLRSDSFSIRFFIAGHPRGESGDWTLCCEMILNNASPAARPPPIDRTSLGDFPPAVAHEAFYRSTGVSGMEYGPLYQGIRQAWHRDDESVADLEVPEALRSEIGFHIHPALLDTVVQLPLLSEGGVRLPVSVDEVYFAGQPCEHARLWAHCRTQGMLRYDATLIAEDGTVLFQVRGATCREMTTPVPDEVRSLETGWIYQRRWEASTLPEYTATPGAWRIVGDPDEADSLTRELEHHGQMRLVCGDAGLRGIVYLATPDDSPVDQRTLCGGFLQFLQSEEQPAGARVFVVGRGVHSVVSGEAPNLSLGPLFGFARTAANEYPRLQLTTVDLDRDAPGFGPLISELLAASDETEVAYRGGKRYVARIGRLPLESQGRRRKRIRLDATGEVSCRVVSPQPGSIERVTLEASRRTPPQEGEIEVRVAAGALNFLDVLRALNMGPAQAAGPGFFGMEFSGDIARVGSGVTRYRAGDRVMAVTPPGEHGLQAWVTIPARCCFPVPADFSMEQAASCLVGYQTAWYALIELGRMRAGDRVLIHAAAGGVGLAAVHIARHVGAEIFATAGSPEKREYLRQLGVSMVMDSRTLDFADEILAATGGHGVDLVLNSISGEAIPRSIAALAPGGRFLEIGKRDIYANSSIELFPFRRNLSFFAIDMLGLTEAREAMVLGITAEVVNRLESGILPPLPVTTFPASRAADAFHYMVRSRQIGKVAVTFGDGELEVEIPASELIRSDATYLVTGGMTGIGLACASWLADRGARHLVLVGRRDPSAAEAASIDAIRAGGIYVHTIVADVSSDDGIRRVIDFIDGKPFPIAGVIHSAGIARDGIIERLDWARFEEVFAPKIQGSWNLHAALLGRELDFFVLFSSVASWLGPAGQANYAAANTFLDSLGEYRRSRGLPVLTVNWGPWTGIGMLVRHGLKPSPIFGEQGIRREQGIACLAALLERDCSQATVMTADWGAWPQVAPGLAAKPLFSDLRVEMSGGGLAGGKPDDPAGEFRNLSRDDGMAIVSARVLEAVVRVLRVSEDRVDAQASLQRLGLDSLMAVELSNHLQAALAVKVPVMTLLKGPSLAELAMALHETLVAPAPSGSDVATAHVLQPATLVQAIADVRQVRPDTWIIQDGEPGMGPALFCLGGVRQWLAVAHQLGTDWRVVGITPRELPADSPRRIEDFAASAVQAIREHQPSGPYVLAGWSVWGLVALEAAQQLASVQEPVELVAIVDTFLPLPSRNLGRVGQLAAWARLEQHRLTYHVHKLRRGEAQLTPEYVRKRFDNLMTFRVRPAIQAALPKSGTPEEIRSSRNLADAVLAANAKYQAKPYTGRALLCAASDRREGTVEEYAGDWMQILAGPVDPLVLQGDHLTIFDPENVGPLAEALRHALNQCRMRPEGQPLPAGG